MKKLNILAELSIGETTISVLEFSSVEGSTYFLSTINETGSKVVEAKTKTNALYLFKEISLNILKGD